MIEFLAAGISYLLGSIPTGLMLTRFFKAGDLRKIGSGNIGATNVLRTGRKKLAFATLLLDALKGMLPVIYFSNISVDLGLIAGVAAVIGHVFPVWLKFKGGKGIATSLGVILGLSWPVGLMLLLVWGLTFYLSRIASLSSVSAALLAPFLAFFLGKYKLALMISALSVLILFKHKPNIIRLIKGEEHKFGRKLRG